jgi:hypothetical protein
MCASPFKFFTDGPPAPKVAFLPNALFFSRSIPVGSQVVDPAAHAAEIGMQVELAFEALAPFPLAQLYHGYFWTEGAPSALAFAAYRRRFTTEQIETWHGAELVIPSFAALLHAPAAPGTTAILTSPEGLTAIHWGSGPVASRIVFRPLAGEATDEERVATREALLRTFESKIIVDLPAAPTAHASDGDGEITFKAGDWTSTFSAAEAAALDVRDKDELAGLRRARQRDVLLWRVGIGCLAAFLLLAAGEVALIGGGLWQKTRRAMLNAQAPTVDRIVADQEVATHIDNLRTKRLLTMEMLAAVAAKKPEQTYFLTVSSSTDKLYTLNGQGQTSNPAEISVFQDALQALPAVAPGGVTITLGQTRNNVSSFALHVTFKPNSLKPGAL